MNTSKTYSNSHGGAVAIRGFLVQTLVALLDITQAESAFTEITLEPQIGNDQFDFYWKDANGTHAVQVKSTENSFSLGEVKEWARKLALARRGEQCRLILVGHAPASVLKIKVLDGVSIPPPKNLDLVEMSELAETRIAKFLGREKLPEGTALERASIVDSLLGKLLKLSSQTLSRSDFIQLLRDWITSTPTNEFKTHLEHFDVFRYVPAELIGREAETQILEDAWDQAMRRDTPRPRVLTFVALGGEGKTALIAKWAADWVNEQGRGGTAIFAWSFYSQGTRDQSSVSSDLFLKEALEFFGDAELANSAQQPYEKAKQLAKLIGKQRALLILDGVEPLQYAPTSPTSPTSPTAGELKDQAIATLLKNLASNSQGLCVLTTRYSIPNLRTFWQSTAPEIKLPRLSTAAGVHLLELLEVKGRPAELEKLVEDVKGHALTLNLLGSYLRDAYAGDIRQRDKVKLAEADVEVQGGHAFRVMDAYVQWLQSDNKKGQQALAMWQLLGLFDRPAPADCLAELLKMPAIPHLTKELMELKKEAQRDIIFSRLEKANLLTVNRDATHALVSLDTHPLIREYFAEKLRREQLGDWQNAHRRIYKHLCKTNEGEQPTLEQLQPLFQAMAHGCAAGLHQEVLEKVYSPRIRRMDENYVCKTLGAFNDELAALANFFIPSLWQDVILGITDSYKARLFNWAGYRLRSLGRFNEAIPLLKKAIDGFVELGDWGNVAISQHSLSELQLVQGLVKEAINTSSKAIDIVENKPMDLSRKLDCFIKTFGIHAYACFQHGKINEALGYFKDTEEHQKKFFLKNYQEGSPYLLSVEGFQYSDLLLSISPAHEVLERAEYVLDLSLKSKTLLSIALARLTLGRVYLQQSTEQIECRAEKQVGAFKYLNLAVDDFQKAGIAHYEPLGFLSRAAYYRYIQQFALAHEDLAEVLDIAEPSGMRLHLTDYHLESARLALAEFPADSSERVEGLKIAHDHLRKAGALIQETGYHRRDGELESLCETLAQLDAAQFPQKSLIV